MFTWNGSKGTINQTPGRLDQSIIQHCGRWSQIFKKKRQVPFKKPTPLSRHRLQWTRVECMIMYPYLLGRPLLLYAVIILSPTHKTSLAPSLTKRWPSDGYRRWWLVKLVSCLIIRGFGGLLVPLSVHPLGPARFRRCLFWGLCWMY